MHTSRNEFFIKRDFGFYDSGILGCLPHIVFDVYEVLRRYVWRSMESGALQWRQLYADNKLAATVSQSEVGEILDRAREVINTHIGTMKDLGWVKVIQDPSARKPATYVLGERVRDSQGRYHEVFYQDAWMQDLWEKLEEAASEGSDVPEKVSRLSWERKREICRAWMAESNLASPRAKPQAVSEESDDVDKTPTERGSIPISFSTENSGSLSSVDLPLSTGVSKVQHEGSGISNLTSHVRLEKPNTRIEKSLNREPTNTYRPASERGIGTFDQPRKSKTSVQSSSLSFSKEDLTNSLPRQKPTEERKTIPKSAPTGLEDKFSESSANTPENSSNTADISTDIGLSRDDIPAPISDRLALLVSIGEGSVPAPLDRTGETYRDKVSRARARQVEQSAARDAKLRNFDGSKPHEVRQVLKHLEGLWAAECRARYGDAAGAWQVQDRKMVEGLLKSYKLGMVESAMRYLAGAWPGLNKRLFKGNGGMVPTIGVLSRCHATLVPESAEYSELSGLADEYNNWWKNNPNEFPPDDLQRRYDAHSSKLKALGLVNP